MIAEHFENVKSCLLVVITGLITRGINGDIGQYLVRVLRKMHCSG